MSGFTRGRYNFTPYSGSYLILPPLNGGSKSERKPARQDAHQYVPLLNLGVVQRPPISQLRNHYATPPPSPS